MTTQEILEKILKEIEYGYIDYSLHDNGELEIIKIACEKELNAINIIDEIESTDWYHINQKGELVHGANSKGEGTEPLYKAEDILAICDKYRSDEE